VLSHSDQFARNGAAEVLQDVGFVDFLAVDNPSSPSRADLRSRRREASDAAETRVESFDVSGVRAA
jgi:hypothetical protein